MSKTAVKIIIEAIGSESICAKLDVSRHAVRYAKSDGVFPAAWYAGLLDLCRGAGIECPLDVFNWKSSADAPSTPETPTSEKDAA